MSNDQSLVKIKIDGTEVSVPKGTNLIEAAKAINIEIPHYCYHPDLSIAGNCRMCQVEINGRPKLEIACNTSASDGLEVKTHRTSKTVADAQAATLEFILINHPLDCTVCDQAGHCKLQDYHYEYNARPSRFLEDKVHKVKALPLGPTVMLDGERCIMCSRCVRFCDEITKTSEIGLVNRGDKTVIAVFEDRPLDNPLSGTVVDLCPVGALTHTKWRFNTRIWFTRQADGICPGCSTGCNVRVASRDGQIVQVKARYNPDVNKEWLCDEGRYGFSRFLPQNRILNGTTTENLVNRIAKFNQDNTVFFVSSDLICEEYALLSELKSSYFNKCTFVVNHVSRSLNETEKILISPDYSCNYKGAIACGLVEGDIETNYKLAWDRLIKGDFHNVVFLGDRSVSKNFLDHDIGQKISQLDSVFIGTDADSILFKSCKLVFAGRSILEKSGVLINQNLRLQYTDRLIDFPDGTIPEWKLLSSLAMFCKVTTVATNLTSERDLTNWFLNWMSLKNYQKLNGKNIKSLKEGGVAL